MVQTALNSLALDPAAVQERQRELAGLGFPGGLPVTLKGHLDRSFRAFLCGLESDAIVNCRPVLEWSAKYLLWRAGMPDLAGICDDDSSLKDLLERAAWFGLMSPSALNTAHRIRKEANRLLHETRTPEVAAVEILRGLALVLRELAPGLIDGTH